MLSNTGGLRHRVVHGHRSDSTLCTTPCPDLAKSGRCAAHEFELSLRREIMHRKDQEMRAQATQLLRLEHESEEEAATGSDAALAGTLRSAGASGLPWKPDPSAVTRIVTSMKSEKAYQEWSLDFDVSKRLAQLRRRSCPYTHLNLAGIQAVAPSAAPSSSNGGDVAVGAPDGAVGVTDANSIASGKVPASWVGAFRQFSVFQKLSVLVLLQGHVTLPRGVICNVEAALRAQKERKRRNQRAAAAGTRVDDSDEEGDEVEVTPEEIAQASATPVHLTVLHVPRGIVNLGSLPEILSYAAANANTVFVHSAASRSPPPTSTHHAEGGCGGIGSQQLPLSGGGHKARSNLVASLIRNLLSDVVAANVAASRTQQKKLEGAAAIAAAPSTKDGRTQDAEAAKTVRQLLSAVGVPRHVSAKELDVSSASRCQEIFDVLAVLRVWLQAIDRAITTTTSASADKKSRGKVSTPRVRVAEETGGDGREQQPVLRLRMLSLRRCSLTTADNLVSLLRKHNLHTDLIGLDLSDNKLDSLRFLFQLRADYKDRLLFLALQNNPITKKPDYREQVRATLPRLVSLDGEPVRREPLRLPYPTASPLAKNMMAVDYAEVLATVDRFLYAWETQQVPRPPQKAETAAAGVCGSSSRRLKKRPRSDELEDSRGRGGRGRDAAVCEIHFGDDDEGHDALFREASLSLVGEFKHLVSGGARREKTNSDGEGNGEDEDDNEEVDVSESEEEEEDADEDTFAKRYLHPECSLSIVVGPGCAWYDPNGMRVANDVTMDSAYAGHRLSAQDLNELRVVDVSMRNHHRNLCLGKPALHRIAKGPVNCFTAYRSTLYPQRMLVDHHTDGCAVQVTMVGDEDDSKIIAEAPPPAANNPSVLSANKRKNLDPYAAKGPLEIQQKKGGAGAYLVPAGPAPAPAVKQEDLFLGKERMRKPLTFVVTLHGQMTWRAPTMAAGGCVTVVYDRVLTLTPRAALPRGMKASERRKMPRFLIVNDMMSLRAATTNASSARNQTANGDAAVLFEPRSEGRLQGTAIEYGLDHTPQTRALVYHVAERATSDAAMHETLKRIVFPLEHQRQSSLEHPPEATPRKNGTAAAGDGEAEAEEDVVRRQRSMTSIFERELSRTASCSNERHHRTFVVDATLRHSELFGVNADEDGEGAGTSDDASGLVDHAIALAADGSSADAKRHVTLAEIDRHLAWANGFSTAHFKP